MTKAALKISLGISVGFFILLVGICWLHCVIKRRKYRTLEQKYFTYNGGLLLHQLANHKGYVDRTARICTTEELKKATNDFSRSRQISEGVYRGILSNKTVVAIKKLNIANVLKVAKFIDEVIALSRINHRNVVRLLGYSLEPGMSLLVYEYISNGTLHEHIHKIKMRGSSPFSLYWRMKAATETAAALAYLHSSISKPVIIPQIVNTTNILFDDNYMVKLLLVPGYPSTLEEETYGYLGPEYFQSSTLTEKSKVFSFGVVLAELLTSQRAVNYDRPKAERMLANVFTRAVEGGTLHQILDIEILREGKTVLVEKVADLAFRCLRDKRADRPTMKQVAMELEGLRIMAKHPGGMLNFADDSPQKTTDPLVTPSEAYVVDAVRSEGFQGGSSSVITNAEAMGSRQLQEVDYYLT